LAVFLAVFLYALSAGLLIQLFILPVLVPHLHAGHGLLRGVDSVGFHEIASAIADRIVSEGWSRWELRPSSHSPAGVAAALYAITDLREPWVMLPINAALFAVSAAVIFAIVRLLTESPGAALAAVLPFVLFPSAALEYADLHKDVWSCAGSFIVVFVLARIQAADDVDLRSLVLLIAGCLAGLVLVWIARAYLVRVLTYAASIAVLAALPIEVSIRRFHLDGSFARKCAAFLFIIGMMAAVTRIPTDDSVRGMGEITAPPPVADVGQSIQSPHSANAEAPGFLRQTVRSIMALRRGFLTTYPDAGSLIDPYVVMEAPADMVSYLPRALQIGFLAPFPSMWFGSGISPGAGMMRLLTGIEMAVVYVLLFGIPLTIPFIAGRAAKTGFLILTMSAIVICLMVMAIPIVGTLHRMRYGYFMLVAGLGAAGWVVAAKALSTKLISSSHHSDERS
jgi:hypothetical protein